MNGDWYIDQMKRKVYDSNPLPILMDHEKYENDVRNSIFVRDDIKKPVELSTLMKIILSEDPRTKLQTQGGNSYNYLPTKTIKITVDKKKVLATKTVSADKASQIADSVIINVSGNYLSKSDLAILDMLANNNWERPIYLDLSVVNTSNIKLDPYLQNEGFAFRFVPIYNPNTLEAINTDILYNRLMNQFVWGNIGDKKIHVDENLKRTTEVVQIKNNFFSLAQKLAEEGKNDKARQVIEKLYTILPIGMYEASYYDIYIASVWYKLKDDAKGDQLMRTVANESFDKINFYQSLGSEYIQSYQRELNREISLMKELIRIAGFSNRTELIKEINDKLSLVSRKSAS
jgi:hypothetical protein